MIDDLVTTVFEPVKYLKNNEPAVCILGNNHNINVQIMKKKTLLVLVLTNKRY